MRTPVRLGTAVLGLSLLVALGAPSARGQAVMTTPVKVATTAVDRAAWLRTIDDARLRSPASFVRVAKLRAELPELDRKRRGSLAPVSAHLQALGRDAREALVERLLEGENDPSLTDTARRAWRAGVVEALGALRDPTLRDVLAPFLDDADQVVARAAASAISKLGDDAAVALLVARFDRAEVIDGAGSCRRRAMASALASVVARRPAAELARATARALGELGSSWAFRTGNVPAPSEEHDVRATASRALLEIFLGYDGDTRRAASNALMMVDDPSTPALIAAAKTTASSDTIAALDALSLRFARNAAR